MNSNALNPVRVNFLGTLANRGTRLIHDNLQAIHNPVGGAPLDDTARQNAPDRAFVERPRAHTMIGTFNRHTFDGLDITVIGNGEIGDKARQLITKTAQLRAIGFHTPPRIVLAENFINEFFKANDIAATIREADGIEDVLDRIETGEFTANQQRALEYLVNALDGKPAAARSSAMGDARGTGAYETDFQAGTVEGLEKALKIVMQGYFSDKARLVRKRAKTGHGFGIIVEPVIGQQIDPERNSLIAPIASGWGFSSEGHEEGYINLVPGMGGGVNRTDVLRLTRTKMERFTGVIGLYTPGNLGTMIIEAIISRANKMVGNRRLRDIAFFRDSRNYNVTLFDPSEGEIHTPLHDRSILKKGLEEINLFPLFDMIKEMDQQFVKHQYYETAITVEEGKAKFWITQIDDVSPETDIDNIADLSKVMFLADRTRGKGERLCPTIVMCMKDEKRESLRAFNEQESGYLLIYSAKMLSEASNAPWIANFEATEFSNAGAVLEHDDYDHAYDPAGHFGGLIEKLGMLFGVVVPKDAHQRIMPHGGYQRDTGSGIMIWDYPVIAAIREIRGHKRMVIKPAE